MVSRRIQQRQKYDTLSIRDTLPIPIHSHICYFYYSAFTSRRSLRNLRSFSRASSSGTITPLFCVAGSSRFRMLSDRESLSCAPTTASVSVEPLSLAATYRR